MPAQKSKKPVQPARKRAPEVAVKATAKTRTRQDYGQSAGQNQQHEACSESPYSAPTQIPDQSQRHTSKENPGSSRQR